MSKFYLVFGGCVSDFWIFDFNDLDVIEFVGVYFDYVSVEKVWCVVVQCMVDDVVMKFVVVYFYCLFEFEFLVV